MSIATRTAALLSLAIGFIFTISAGIAYLDSSRQSIDAALAKLDSYNLEIASEQQERFQRIVSAHRHASELLAGELAAQKASAGATREFQRLYPRQADGSRRSIDALFEGGETSFGFVRGIGGFLRHEPKVEEARMMLAATRIIHVIGEGIRPELKSMSFFTPSDSLLMFAPDRPDRLLYYRRDAPSDLTLAGREFLDVTLPSNNPERRTRCTSLQPILYDPTGRTWTTGCMTPVHVEGRYVGGWGSSLLLDDLLAGSRFDEMPGAEVILISREGRLIRHPRYTLQNHAGTQRYLDLTKAEAPELQAVWALVRRTGDKPFLGAVPEMQAYAAVRQIPTPGWYAVTLQPEALITQAARQELARAAMIALICLALQASLLFLILRRNVREPLRTVIRNANALARQVGGGDSGSGTLDGDEVGQLAASFELMADEVLRAHASLEAKVTERTEQLARANEKLRILAETDGLTGLLNRRRVTVEIETVLRQEHRASVILFDVDHFKRINDGHGHSVGDEVLCAIAERVRTLMRPHDRLARVGGEEFLVLLPATDGEEALLVAERLREAVREVPMAIGDVEVRSTISLGVAEACAGDTVQRLYNRADAALYAAKRDGRDRSRLTQEAVRPIRRSHAR